MKKIISLIAASVLSAMMLITPASATALDDIGGGQSVSTPTPSGTGGVGLAPDDTPAQGSGGENIGNVYSDIGVSKEDMEQAKTLISPAVKWINIGIGVIVGILGTILIGITALDLLYIVSPTFIRNIGSNGAAAAAPQGGMGMGAMGGMGMQQAQPQQETGFASLISDDCRNAMAECGAQMAAAGAGAAPMGGMGMGGMGMGRYGGMGGMGMGMGMGAQAPAAQPKAKKVVLCYLKKRVVTFVLIGVCAVVLTCTCFLDVGTTIGQWIVNQVSGLT